MERIAVAMSGGVDSSVAAALLHRAGYQVVGFTMRLWTLLDADLPGPFRSCCSVEDVDDARATCQTLGIPHYTLNFEREFQAFVVDTFCQEYERGRTPNPCVLCNEHMKFRFLLERAQSLGIGKLATGHYARVEGDGLGGYRLLRAADQSKDQSYVLYMLSQETLGQVILPLGKMSKGEVRALAAKLRLPVADKPDSQDICFIPGGDYRRFVEERIRAEPGGIVDLQGQVVGWHRGIPFYTVGQRHGLGLAAGERLYVVQIDVANNRLVVGPEAALYAPALCARDVSYVAGRPPAEPVAIAAKIRSRSREAAAELLPLAPDRALLRFVEPQRAITPGQSVVFYRGDEVLGGGLIERAISSTSEWKGSDSQPQAQARKEPVHAL